MPAVRTALPRTWRGETSMTIVYRSMRSGLSLLAMIAMLSSATAGECYRRVTIPPRYAVQAESVLVRPGIQFARTIPGSYRTVEEPVLLRPARTVARTVPGIYRSVTETVEIAPARADVHRDMKFVNDLLCFRPIRCAPTSSNFVLRVKWSKPSRRPMRRACVKSKCSRRMPFTRRFPQSTARSRAWSKWLRLAPSTNGLRPNIARSISKLPSLRREAVGFP